MQSRSVQLNFIAVVTGIVLAALSRLLPHPPNFAPMMAIGIFGGALFRRRIWALVIPIAAIWLSDLLLNNVVYGAYFEGFVWLYDGWYWQYGVYLLVPIIAGSIFKNNISVAKIAGMGIGTAVLFFLVSNFGVWATTTMYPKTSEGLVICYTMGLPFLKGTLLSNLFYCVVLFGTYYLLENKTHLFVPGAKYNWKWI